MPDGTFITENKKEYKAKLAHGVYKKYPRFFGYSSKVGIEKVSHKLDAKSDLYIYFYFHGLSLLDEKGSFCFITSNSWLDVGYGKDLQEFLLKRCHTKLVIDNKAKRSFKEADINTVIVLFSQPADLKVADEVSLEKAAKFVMFYVPFEEALHPVVFEEIEEATEKKPTEEYRVFPISQGDLLVDGCEISSTGEEEAELRTQLPYAKVAKYKYLGNKWGGKHLRAPDIFHLIVMKSNEHFATLGKASWIKFGRGRRTGADSYFYVDRTTIQDFKIEKRFLKPLVKSPTEFVETGPLTSSLHNKYFVFLCDQDKSSLQNTGALNYINFGESKGIHEKNLARVAGLWWNLGKQQHAQIILPIAFNDRFFAIHNDAKYEVHQRFATLTIEKPYENNVIPIVVSLNSTITALMAEVLGRRNLGQGALDFPPDDWRDVIILDPTTIEECTKDSLKQIWDGMKNSSPIGIIDEIQSGFKKRLDQMIFDCLNLTKAEQVAVYDAVIDLVSSRLEKARSL
jgi:hypothetical protein